MANGTIYNPNSEWEQFNLSISLGGTSYARGYKNKKAGLCLVTVNPSNASGDGTINISNMPSKYIGIQGVLRNGGYLTIDDSKTKINIVGATTYGVGQIVYPLADQPFTTENYMATGTIKRPNNKALFFYSTPVSQHAVTKRSTNGVYYSQTEIDVAREGLDPIGCYISYWSGISANFTPYITSSNKLGFISDVSQTLGDVVVIITYRER